MTSYFDTIEQLATFCAALVREGVTFTSRPHKDGWLVTFGGGY